MFWRGWLVSRNLEASGGNSQEDRVRAAFNLSEFLTLAHRVIDQEDSAALTALTDLKTRWEAKFGDQSQKLRPVSSHVATPFRLQPVVRMARRFPRLPSLDQQRDILTLPKGVNSIDPVPNRDNSHGNPDSASGGRCRLDIQAEGPLVGEREKPASPIVLPESITGNRVLDEGIHQEQSQYPPVELFVGKVKLNSPHTDTIADAFLKSTRKTLRYIDPLKQRDEIVIRPTTQMVEQGSKRWQATAVGYVLGKKPYFPQLEAYVRMNWMGLEFVSATSNGFYFFQFKTVAYMEEIIEGGPWLFQGQPIVLQCWEPGMSLRRQKHTKIPVWIRLKHLPVEYWTDEGLSAVASGVGIPLYSDKITKSCSRLDYARVCILLDYNSVLPKHLVVISPILHEGKEIPTKIDIEYEWLPQRCKLCCSLGHSAAACPEGRKGKSAPVVVFVKKKHSVNVDSSVVGEVAGPSAEVGMRWRMMWSLRWNILILPHVVNRKETWLMFRPHAFSLR
ncbi:UNVERIFIED_CONTAM: hypothetical protein Sradi_7274100 [Sesamum radiatum]|uniref:DUF4283 domain-containing protein n=1 Tax=Sesamum radiatum TaxID=300843 RepID=A0AAW2IJA9_SESRA